MLYLLTLILGLVSSCFADDEGSKSSTEDFKKVPKNVMLEEKKSSPFQNVGFGYSSETSTVNEGFSGKAFYKMPVQSKEVQKQYVTAGAKVASSKMILSEFSDQDQMMALAQIGYNLEIGGKEENKKTLHLQFAQPVYDTQSQFSPLVELSYDVKF
jgi:hypothetical protein